MSSLISLIEQYIQEKQLGHSSVDRDFSTLQETNNSDLENNVLSAKKWKWLQLQRELQSPEIIIMLDINCNVREHVIKNNQDNPIQKIMNFFSSDYLVSIQTIDGDITDSWYEYITNYSSTSYKSSIDRIIKKANEYIEDWIIPIIISDFLDCSSEVNDLLCIQIILPIVSLHYHDYYANGILALQTNYLYQW